MTRRITTTTNMNNTITMFGHAIYNLSYKKSILGSVCISASHHVDFIIGWQSNGVEDMNEMSKGKKRGIHASCRIDPIYGILLVSVLEDMDIFYQQRSMPHEMGAWGNTRIGATV